MKNFRENGGITLIALVVTIIVLLILAGVSISMLTGEDGILERANEAKEETQRATDDEQRKMAVLEAAMNTENTEYTDPKTNEKITIPAGFAPTSMPGESTVDEGLVITDSQGNEFVWIPVESGEIEKGGAEKLNDDVPWEREEYEEMKKSVKEYKGFYIGRYEAGSTTERKGWQTGGNETTKMVVQRDQYPYVFVGWGKYNEGTRDYSDDMIYNGDDVQNENNGKGAVYLCRHMYDGQSVGVKSTLCYGIQWDAMLDFIKEHSFNTDSDSTKWGNYYGLEFKITRKTAKKQLVQKNSVNMNKYMSWETAYGVFGANDEGWVLTTGATDRNKAVNLYDVAGNCQEWTMEKKEDENMRNCRRRIGTKFERLFDSPRMDLCDA